jgi:5'-deoxynucleotidase YfbR-like HD superfamily hydrolase
MKDKHPAHEVLSTEEQRLIQELRKRPELMERFKHIVDIATDSNASIKTADEVESLLIEEMRRLGNATRAGWGEEVERKLGEELKQKHTSAAVRKKKR